MAALMICAKDGSRMRVVTEAPEFKVWACEAACHHLRVGSDPPPPGAAAHVINPVKLARQTMEKPDDICTNNKCRRPRYLTYKQCWPCIVIRRAAMARYKARLAEVALA